MKSQTQFGFVQKLLGSGRRAYDLALAGAIGAVFGLYLYVELIATSRLVVRDLLAGASLVGRSALF